MRRAHSPFRSLLALDEPEVDGDRISVFGTFEERDPDVVVGLPQAPEIFGLRDVVPFEVIDWESLTLQRQHVGIEGGCLKGDVAHSTLLRRGGSDGERVIVIGIPLPIVAVVEPSVLVEVLAGVLDLDAVWDIGVGHSCVVGGRVRRIGIVSLAVGRVVDVGVSRIVSGVTVASRHHHEGGRDQKSSQHVIHLSAMGLSLCRKPSSAGITPVYRAIT